MKTIKTKLVVRKGERDGGSEGRREWVPDAGGSFLPPSPARSLTLPATQTAKFTFLINRNIYTRSEAAGLFISF